jgi:hypothetical protein
MERLQSHELHEVTPETKPGELLSVTSMVVFS